MDFEIIHPNFHQILFRKYQVRKIKPKDQTLRNLLCLYLSFACEKYPTEQEFNLFQQEAYDMSYQVHVSTVGTYSIITYTLKAVDPKYIKDDKYNPSFLEDAFMLCQRPVIKENNFDSKLFKKVKEIYYSNLLYQEENEAKTAVLNAISAYYKGTIRDFKPDGDIDELEKITCKKLYNYYLSTLKDEEVSYVAGDCSNLFHIENHSTMTVKHHHFFKKRAECNPYIEHIAKTGQTYLEIIYDTKIYPNQSLFYAISFLNYIFGGCPNSKLFSIVREKYGLCYSISSTHFGASGILLVSAILHKKDLNKALTAIDEAFDDVLTHFPLEDVKKHFLLERKGKLDYLQSYIYDDFLDRFFPNSFSSVEEEQQIQKITIKDIKMAYRRIKKSLVYVYGGDKNEESVSL